MRTRNQGILSASGGGYKSLLAYTSDDSQSTVDCALTKAIMETDPEFARILSAWPTISAPLKAAILAIVGSARSP